MRWFPTSVDPWFTISGVQVALFAIVAVLLRLPLVSLASVGASAAGMRAVCWLLSGEVLFMVLGAVTAVSTSDTGAAGFTVANGLQSLTREFPRSGLAGAALANVVLVPVFEEFVFRVLVLGFLLKPLRPWLALAMSTALFASVHSSWLPAAFGGVVYGLLYLRYRSVWLCIFAHAANNLIVAYGVPLLFAWLHENDAFHPLQGSLLVLQLSWVAVVLACFAMFLTCLRQRDEATSQALIRSG
ncbi:MAG: CPBP family intramembrane glutamic endopeptidase [Burkholderiaceae bacterium]